MNVTITADIKNCRVKSRLSAFSFENLAKAHLLQVKQRWD